MAQEPSKAHIQELIRLSEASRACLTNDYVALRHRLDVPARIRGSLNAHPTGWIVGTAVSGFVASRLFRRSKPSKPVISAPKGFLMTLVGLGIAAAKPLAKIWLTGELKRYLLQFSNPQEEKSFPQKSSY